MATLLQPPYASRGIISEDLEGLRISIPGQWSWALLFPAAWLCAWTLGGIAAVASLFHHFSFFVLLWMFGWAVGETVVGYNVLYAIGGREIILASADTLTCRKPDFRPGRHEILSCKRNAQFAISAGREFRPNPHTQPHRLRLRGQSLRTRRQPRPIRSS